MAGVDLELVGADALSSTTAQAAARLRNWEPAHREAGARIIATGRQNAPRLTGRLAGSLHVLRAGADTVEVGTSVRYAGFQNWGTRRNRPTYFLTRALDDPSLDAIYARYVDQALGMVRGA